jgi:serine/threonine-protein kinase
MTTRDRSSREYPRPGTPAGDGGREPTQSLSVAPGEPPPASPMALGTHNRQSTSIASPNGRGKTPMPPASARTPAMLGHHPDTPDEYLDAVLGSYRVIELLGQGGMGYVYRAEHIKLGREVALKLLRSDYAIRRDAVARFFQEARTVNRVRHRNIVDVTDFVELDDGTTYIIMELLTGTSLGTWARSGVDLPRALAVLVQICDGLGAAHQVGVVHRDLKPDNVIIVPTSDGAELVKLLDFGVAKLLNRDDEDVGFLTAAGSVIGTPAYMSPEQAGGMVIDARSDIYSLGAIMYELFCGEPMFRGRSFGEYVRKHLTEVPVPPRQTPGGAGLDPQLEALILKSLEKDPDQRFANVVELREALLYLLGGMGLLTGTHPPSMVTGSGMRPQPGQFPLMPQVGYATAPSSQLSQASGWHASQSQPSGHNRYAPPGARPATPWGIWFIGGAVAVGLGVTTAVWYAGRDEPALGPSPALESTRPAQPPAQPVVPPIAVPIDPPAAHPQPIEVRFDSLPSGGVFAEGHAAELCRTPCALNIDLADGGPTDRRAFVVRRDGYADGAVTVDLAGDKRAFHVMLQPTASPPTASPSTDPTADAKPDKRPVKRTVKSTRKDGKDGKDARDPAASHEPRDARDPDVDHRIDPTDGKPTPTKKPPVKPTIDPSDTLDPFHKK